MDKKWQGRVVALEEQIKAKDQRIKDLEQQSRQVQHLQDEYDRLRVWITKIRDEGVKQKPDPRIPQLQQAVDDLREQLSALGDGGHESMQQVIANVQRVSKGLDDVRALQDQLTKDVQQQMGDAVKEMRHELDNQAKQIEELYSRTDSARKMANEARKSVRRDVEQVNSTMREHDAKMQKVMVQIELHGKKMTAVDTYNAQAKRVGQELRQLKHTIDRLEGKVKSLGGTRDDVQAKIQALQPTIDTVNTLKNMTEKQRKRIDQLAIKLEEQSNASS